MEWADDALARLIFVNYGSAVSAAKAANVLVTDISKDHISIRSNFTGESLLLFGAIDTSIYGPVDGIVVTLRGPNENVMLRKKQKQFGIWVNDAAYKWDRCPDFMPWSARIPQCLNVFDEQQARGIGTRACKPIC